MAIINGNNFDNDLIGTVGNDSIFGAAGNDTLDGRGIAFNSNQRDTLTGGLGDDNFVLGNSLGAYYLDSVGFGENSYAIINDFNALEGDEIEVFGNRSDYSLQAYLGGMGIFYQGDLIGVVENTIDLSLDVNFSFTNSIGLDPINPAQYLASHGDLILAFNTLPYEQSLDAANQHYVQFGFNEGRLGDTFDEDRYLASNPDLILAFNPLTYNVALGSATQHYIQFGANEGRIV